MSPMLNIGISITVSILLGYFFYFKSKNVKQMVFHFARICLQPIAHKDVKILYKNESISSLHKLTLLIYNGGNVEIRNSDIPEKDPPKIYFMEGVKLLSFELLDKSNKNIEINFRQTEDGNLETVFNYLNPKDGYVIEIMYDAKEEIEHPFKFSSSLIGGDFRIYDNKLNFMKYILLLMPFMIFGISRRPLPSDPSLRKRVLEQIANRPEWLTIFEYTSFGVMALICIIIFIRITQKNIIPKFCRKYFKEKDERITSCSTGRL